MDKILIQQLQTKALIGVYPQERQQPQPLWLDIDLELTKTTATHSDRLEETVDYANVCQSLQRFIEQTQFQLLETLAEQAAKLLLENFNIERCRITLYKKPLDIPNIQRVAVMIERSRD